MEKKTKRVKNVYTNDDKRSEYKRSEYKRRSGIVEIMVGAIARFRKIRTKNKHPESRGRQRS